MKGRLVAHKSGNFTNKETGEVINYDKFIVMSEKRVDHIDANREYHGYEISEFRAKFLGRPTHEYDSLLGKVVNLTFEQVYGSKNPELVDITE